MYDFRMRPIACAIALLLLNSVIFAQSDAAPKLDRDEQLSDITYCPRTHALQGTPEEEYWLEGSIRDSKVRMYLHRAGADVVGLFYSTDGDWTPTFLGGDWTAKEVNLLGESADETPKGRLVVQLVNGAFVGSWTLLSSDHADPVRVAAFQKPACDGSGAWKRFDDPKWPVSFSYPASWHIKETGDALQIICPDPEEMAYDRQLTIYEGKEDNGKPIGPFELVRCAKAWRFGPKCDSYDKGAVTAAVTTVSGQPGRTILSLGHEWRIYCADGGYRGQVEGGDEVVLLGNYWIEFMAPNPDMIDRLVKSAQLRTTPNAK